MTAKRYACARIRPNQCVWLSAWGFLLVCYRNRSCKIHCFWSGGMRQTDRQTTDESQYRGIALCPNDRGISMQVSKKVQHTATTTTFRSLHTSACVSRHRQSRTGGFCRCKVLLPACPCWRQPAHSDWWEDAVMLNSVIYTLSVS